MDRTNTNLVEPAYAFLYGLTKGSETPMPPMEGTYLVTDERAEPDRAV